VKTIPTTYKIRINEKVLRSNPVFSKVDGFTRALRSICLPGTWSQLHANDDDKSVAAEPENNTDETVLLEVRAKGREWVDLFIYTSRRT
jgi:hypothetical protein